MAEASDLSRTEPASPQRLRQAREAGDVPRSAEFSAWLVLLAALAVLGWQAPRLLAALQSVTAAAFSTAAQPFSPLFLGALEATLWTLLPLFAAVFAAALVAPLLLSGWTYAPQVARADLARANPWRPLLRLFSADAWVDALLALVKWAAAALAVGWALATGWSALGTLADGAALVGAESFDLGDVTVREGEVLKPRLTDARVRADVSAYLAAAPTGSVEGLELESATTPDGLSARVTLSSYWRPPALTVFVPEGLRLEVTATARSVFD